MQILIATVIITLFASGMYFLERRRNKSLKQLRRKTQYTTLIAKEEAKNMLSRMSKEQALHTVKIIIDLYPVEPFWVEVKKELEKP